MRVLVAGATGVIGHQLVPLLTSAGHDVIGMARRDPGVLDGTRTQMVIADALDGPAVAAAVRQAKPDAVVNMLTAIPAGLHPRRMAREYDLTNRLRTEGTRHLLAAAAACDGSSRRASPTPTTPPATGRPTRINRSGGARPRSSPPCCAR
jgi:nucleoside-diphosphate-sugar epimerase